MHIINFCINIYYPQYTVLHILSHCTSYTFYFIICSLFHYHLYLYIYSLVLCFTVLLLMLFLFSILLLLYYFFCTFHWADLSRPTFHYWLYPVWLCMWQIIKNLEPICSITGINVILFSGLDDPPSVPNRPKLDELSGQWTSLQVDTQNHLDLDVNREMTEPLIVLGWSLAVRLLIRAWTCLGASLLRAPCFPQHTHLRRPHTHQLSVRGCRISPCWTLEVERGTVLLFLMKTAPQTNPMWFVHAERFLSVAYEGPWCYEAALERSCLCRQCIWVYKWDFSFSYSVSS